MSEFNTLVLVGFTILFMYQLFVMLEKRKRISDLRNIVHILVLDQRTGRVYPGHIDLREEAAVVFQELGLTFTGQHNERDSEAVGIQIAWEDGREHGIGFSTRQVTQDHGHLRFLIMRHGGDVAAAIRGLEADYFGTDEGPGFPPPIDVDKDALVAEAPTWCFVFAERGTLDHVILTPQWWRHLRGIMDEERIQSLPKARNVFRRAGIAFDDESDKPVDSRYRRLPTKEEVQAFADGVGKTIAFFVARGNGYHGLSVERKFLVTPQK